MKKLSTALFQSSIFNIGAGFDLEPIKRFHHLTNTFIYTNVYIDCEEITAEYCGDGSVDGSEQCDDANNINNDGYRHSHSYPNIDS